jgi:hypothetical protein
MIPVLLVLVDGKTLVMQQVLPDQRRTVFRESRSVLQGAYPCDKEDALSNGEAMRLDASTPMFHA